MLPLILGLLLQAQLAQPQRTVEEIKKDMDILQLNYCLDGSELLSRENKELKARLAELEKQLKELKDNAKE